ncbi:MAG TPA: hypothetical protein VGO52_07935 [Hyphomonadaceae bacterium]|jgi:hypothetical protein|nr:hypothetical protein [Hyphomonadaceae bacterium]
MNIIRPFAACLFAGALLAGAALAQTPPPTAVAPKSEAQTQFDAAKDLYDKDMGYFAEAVVKLREANKASNSMACEYADLAVVSPGSAQVQLEKMIALMEAAHLDTAAYHTAYDENAAQFTLRKASLKSGCG